MVVLSIIVGVLLIIGGCACMFNPGVTFLTSGYLIAILLLVYGIVGIINVIRKYAHPMELLMHIPAIIIGVIAIIRPGSTLVLDTMLVYFLAIWFIIQGIVSICVSVQARKTKIGWYWGVVLGILALLLGIYTCFHPMVSALAIGILIGFYLIDAGINMIVLATAVHSLDD